MDGTAGSPNITSDRERILRILWAGLMLPLLLPDLHPAMIAGALVGIILLSLAARAAPPLLVVITAVLAAGSLFVQQVAGLLVPIDEAVCSLSRRIGMPVVVAPSLLASRAIIGYVAFAVATRRLREVRAALAINVVLPLGAYAAIAVLSGLRTADCSMLGLFFSLYWTVLLAANAVTVLPALAPSVDHRADRVIRALLFALAVGFLTLACGRFIGRPAPFKSPAERDIVVFTPSGRGAHGLTFASSLDAHGLGRIGLYGDLPIFLRRLGFNVAEYGSLERLSRGTCDILVCPSLERPLQLAEQDAVAAFLSAGGCLILAAEHTNIDSNATTVNALLATIGLRVKFDTTHNLLSESLLGTVHGATLLGRSVRRSSCLQHNRGASLGIRSLSGEPVLLGRFWLSDQGDSLAPDRAFMGDGHLSPGDRLGNLMLMAEARVGKGKVFLSGDSSLFLNQNLAYNAGFLATLFTMWPEEGADLGRAAAAVAAAITFLLLVWTARSHRASPSYVLAALAAVAGALLFVGWLGRAMIMRYGVDDRENLVVISMDENNVFDRDPFGARSVTALALGAFRSGHLSEVGSWRSRRQPPRCLFVINPTGGTGPRARHELESLATSGTHVVLAGDGDNPVFAHLVRTFGFDVTGQPLGSGEGNRFTTYSAWAVADLPAIADTFVVDGIPIGGTVPCGRGKMTVIADGGFFLSRNLEQEFTFDEENCAFLAGLLGQVEP